MIKAILLTRGIRYDITDDIKNWDEISISSKRRNYGGVIRTFSNKFEFTGDAYKILENEYLTNYTKSSSNIIIGVLNDNWTYNEKFRCQLDFSTYNSDGNTISMNAIDDSIDVIIRAKKSQVYDILVSDLSPKKFLYDRLVLHNKVSFFINPTSSTLDQEESGVYPIEFVGNNSFPLLYGDTNFLVKGKIEPLDAIGYSNETSGIPSFIKSYSTISVNVDLSFSITLTKETWRERVPRLLLWVTNEDGVKIREFELAKLEEINTVYKINESFNIDLLPNYSLKLFFDTITNINEPNKAIVSGLENISVSYFAKNEPVYIDSFHPNDLLASILNNMGIDFAGEIEKGPLPTPYFVAAESIRGFAEAKVHTSFSKFLEWAKSFGYDYEIIDTKVVFKHITNFYDNSKILQLDYTNSLDFNINESLIYSGVDVGFEKKDYDEINGRDEFHFTNSYSTGLSIKDNILKLISPYRADCFGIEFLASKRNEETKDDSSDNDLFLIHLVKDENGNLIIYRDNIPPKGTLSPESVFNVSYSPRNLLKASVGVIGACTEILDFTASNGNSSLSIHGEKETDSITINTSERIFRIENIKIDTNGLSPFPGIYNGIIMFDYAGKTYEGYISEIKEYLGKAKTTSYSLMCRKIE